MALVVNDRVKETSTTTGTGTFNLAGAATGFDTFVAGIATGNTTYYAIFNQGTTEWEVGLGTVTDATPDTLSRTTIYSSSNSDSAVDFAAGTKDVFCTLPASKAVFGKQEGTDFTNSLLVGHSTTGTLDAATGNTGVGITAMDAITSADNGTYVGFGAGTAVTSGAENTFIGAYSGVTTATTSKNTGVGVSALQDNTGIGNTGVGWNASSQNTSGNYNTSVGEEALEGVDGNANTGNTAVGFKSNTAVTTGGYNTTIGYQSGDNITTGDGNVIIGGVDAASATDDRQLMITGYDGSTTTTWIQGGNDGNLEVTTNWNPSLSTTGKAFVMGF